jgi:ribosome-associated protein
MSPVSKAPAAPKSAKPRPKTAKTAESSAAESKKTAKPKAVAKAKPGADKPRAAPKPRATAADKAAKLEAAIAAASEGVNTPRKRAKRPVRSYGDIEALQALIVEKLEDDKAEELVVIDLKEKSPLADYIVVASGRSQRHVAAMADHLSRALKESGMGKARVEGLPQADWVLIDAGDVIVHLFRPEVRAFYQIEKIWSVEPGKSGHLVSST